MSSHAASVLRENKLVLVSSGTANMIIEKLQE